MGERRSVACLMILAACAGVAVYWEAVAQPRLMSRQVFRQMEIHTDGRGDQAAAERRMITVGQHLPAEIAAGVAAAVIVFAVVSGKKPAAPQAGPPADSHQEPLQT